MAGWQLTPEEQDYLIRTVIGEAANQGALGQQAVAAVIQNRAAQSGMGVKDVVLAKNQFEPWGARADELRAIDPNSPRYQQVLSNLQPFINGDVADPTNGATHFYAPKAQAALGRNAPTWDNGTGVDLGDHRFFNLGYNPGRSQGNRHGIVNQGNEQRYRGMPVMQQVMNPDAQPANPADVPAPNATPAMLQAMQNQNGFAVPQPAEQSPWDKMKSFMNGGRPWNLADALTGAGAAAMARDNPQGAAVLASMGTKDTTGSEWERVNYNEATGKGLFMNKKTGQIAERDIGTPFKKFEGKDYETFQERQNNLSVYDDLIRDGDKFRNMIADGQVNLDLVKQGESAINNITGQSTVQDQNAAAYWRYLNKMRNASLNLAKGVQTDKDAARVMDEYIQGFSKYDNAQNLTALDDIIKTQRRGAQNTIQLQEAIFRDYGQSAPRGPYLDDYKSKMADYDKFETAFAPKRQRFLEQRSQGGGGASTAPVRPGQGTQGRPSIDTLRKSIFGNQ